MIEAARSVRRKIAILLLEKFFTHENEEITTEEQTRTPVEIDHEFVEGKIFIFEILICFW